MLKHTFGLIALSRLLFPVKWGQRVSLAEWRQVPVTSTARVRRCCRTWGSHSRCDPRDSRSRCCTHRNRCSTSSCCCRTRGDCGHGRLLTSGTSSQARGRNSTAVGLVLLWREDGIRTVQDVATNSPFAPTKTTTTKNRTAIFVMTGTWTSFSLTV